MIKMILSNKNKFYTTIVILLLIEALTFRGELKAANQVCDGARHDCTCASSTICWCCDENGNFGETCGNCVWWAWHEACCNWNVALPWCTNANTWDEQARSHGYSVGTTPEVHSIFVVNAGTWGHVGWLTDVNPDGSFETTEMSCGGPCGILTRHRNAGYADAFIYDPNPEPPPPEENIEPEPVPEPEPPVVEPIPEPEPEPEISVDPDQTAENFHEEILTESLSEETVFPELFPQETAADDSKTDVPTGNLGLESGCGCIITR